MYIILNNLNMLYFDLQLYQIGDATYYVILYRKNVKSRYLK